MRPTRLTPLVLSALLVAVACTWDGEEECRERGAPECTPLVEASPITSATAGPAGPAVATPSATATPAPAAPYRVTFAAGETIDVSPVVVFADRETIEAKEWVIPSAGFEFVVSPAGTYVIYNAGDGFKLLRTGDGSVNSLGIGEWPVELGPGESGFVARGEEQFFGSLFDGKGKGLRSLCLSDPEKPFVAAWAPDGRSIAITQIDGDVPRVKLDIWPELMSPSSPALFSRRASQETRPSLEWSPDSERLALVASDAVCVFDRERTLLWIVEGEFFGNPRWAPDGDHLTVSALPPVLGRDGLETGIGVVTYLVTRDGAEELRVTGAGGCSTDPWRDATSFIVGRNLITVDGEISAYGGRIPEIWYGPGEFGVELAPGLGFHLSHMGARTSGQFLEDGRLVFTTPGIGHGGRGLRLVLAAGFISVGGTEDLRSRRTKLAGAPAAHLPGGPQRRVGV